MIHPCLLSNWQCIKNGAIEMVQAQGKNGKGQQDEELMNRQVEGRTQRGRS